MRGYSSLALTTPSPVFRLRYWKTCSSRSLCEILSALRFFVVGSVDSFLREKKREEEDVKRKWYWIFTVPDPKTTRLTLSSYGPIVAIRKIVVISLWSRVGFYNTLPDPEICSIDRLLRSPNYLRVYTRCQSAPASVRILEGTRRFCLPIGWRIGETFETLYRPWCWNIYGNRITI